MNSIRSTLFCRLHANNNKYAYVFGGNYYFSSKYIQIMRDILDMRYLKLLRFTKKLYYSFIHTFRKKDPIFEMIKNDEDLIRFATRDFVGCYNECKKKLENKHNY